MKELAYSFPAFSPEFSLFTFVSHDNSLIRLSHYKPVIT